MDKTSPNYLLEQLGNVYTNAGQASLCHVLVFLHDHPDLADRSADDDAGRSAKRWPSVIDWDICGGQSEMGKLGYSPLPINLAQAGFSQMSKLHTAEPRTSRSASATSRPSATTRRSAPGIRTATTSPRSPRSQRLATAPDRGRVSRASASARWATPPAVSRQHQLQLSPTPGSSTGYELHWPFLRHYHRDTGTNTSTAGGSDRRDRSRRQHHHWWPGPRRHARVAGLVGGEGLRRAARGAGRAGSAAAARAAADHRPTPSVTANPAAQGGGPGA